MTDKVEISAELAERLARFADQEEAAALVGADRPELHRRIMGQDGRIVELETTVYKQLVPDVDENRRALDALMRRGYSLRVAAVTGELVEERATKREWSSRLWQLAVALLLVVLGALIGRAIEPHETARDFVTEPPRPSPPAKEVPRGNDP